MSTLVSRHGVIPYARGVTSRELYSRFVAWWLCCPTGLVVFRGSLVIVSRMLLAIRSMCIVPHPFDRHVRYALLGVSTESVFLRWADRAVTLYDLSSLVIDLVLQFLFDITPELR